MRSLPLALACAVLLICGCNDVGSPPGGESIRMKNGIVIPQEWTDVSYHVGLGYQEFVATGDLASWERWCSSNRMPSEQPDDVNYVAVRRPRLWHLKLSRDHDDESSTRLRFRRSKVQPNGADRRCWFDPESQRIIYQEGFW